MDRDTLFSHTTDGDTKLCLLPPQEGDSLFSSTDIRVLSKQFTSARPITFLPPQPNGPQSTLFGSFSEDVNPPSPASSILSPQDEVTQHTLPDDDDIWNQPESQISGTRKVDTWESFGVGRKDVKQEGNPFVTEQDPKMFDDFLRRHMNHIFAPNESGIVVDEHLFREVTFAPKHPLM